MHHVLRPVEDRQSGLGMSNWPSRATRFQQSHSPAPPECKAVTRRATVVSMSQRIQRPEGNRPSREGPTHGSRRARAPARRVTATKSRPFDKVPSIVRGGWIITGRQAKEKGCRRDAGQWKAGMAARHRHEAARRDGDPAISCRDPSPEVITAECPMARSVPRRAFGQPGRLSPLPTTKAASFGLAEARMIGWAISQFPRHWDADDDRGRRHRAEIVLSTGSYIQTPGSRPSSRDS